MTPSQSPTDDAAPDRLVHPAQGGLAETALAPSRIPTPDESDPPAALPESRRPRWWTVLAVTAISIFATVTTATVLMGVLATWQYGVEALQNPEIFERLSKTRVGFLTLVVVPQLALLVTALIAAAMSPIGFWRRLGLVRGRWPLWLWFAAAMATPLVGILSGLIVSLFLDESPNLKQMGEAFRFLGTGGFAIVIAVAIGLTPAICEEILFRGYGQTRLVRSFPPAVGIVFASVLFAAFHLEPIHVVSVFPLGLWLGVVSYRSGSLIPAMMGHFTNNFVSVVMMIYGPAGEDAADQIGDLPAAEIAADMVVHPVVVLLAAAVLVGGTAGLFLTVRAMLRRDAPAASPSLAAGGSVSTHS